MKPLLTFVAALLSAGIALAQDAADETAEAVVVDEAAQAEARSAWGQNVDAALDEEVATVQESDSFARIHEADEGLLVVESAQDVIGFDVMEGAR
jgi:hypothetical protein